MFDSFAFLAWAIPIGLGATAFMDITALVRKSLAGTPLPDYALVGRWLAHMPRGRFRHSSIAAAAPIPGERLTGWTVHYLTGIAFAALLLVFFGPDWVHHPVPGPALAVGIVSVAAPFLLMQPGMGAGLASRRSPSPNAARLRSLVTHTIFGLGLYAAGWITHLLAR
jgi:hypothetical protein